MTMTERDRIALVLMQDRMWVTADEVGRAVYDRTTKRGGSNILAIDAAVIGRLRKRGLVYYLADCKAWRITKAGQVSIKADEGER